MTDVLQRAAAAPWRSACYGSPPATARLTRRCGATGIAGGRRGEEWLLTLPPRWRGNADPLTGWWGRGDPLSCTVLRFPSRRAAESYAEREGLALDVVEPPRANRDVCGGAVASIDATELPLDPVLPWVWDGRAVVLPQQGCDRVPEPVGSQEFPLEQAILDPASVFAKPAEVAQHAGLTTAQKLEILARWRLDAALIETAEAEGMPDRGEPSLLEEVLAAERLVRSRMPQQQARVSDRRQAASAGSRRRVAA